MIRTFILALPLVLLAAPAAAGGINCSKAVVQMDLNTCADQEYHVWDKKLNDAYRAASAQEDAKGRELLKQSERAWIAYRDAECAYQANASEGGSIQPMEYSNCLTEKTKARIKELQR